MLRGEGNKIMAEVRVKENESLDSALRRFKRQVARDGKIAEVKKKEHTKNRALSARKNRKLQENANSRAEKQIQIAPESAKLTEAIFHQYIFQRKQNEKRIS